MNGLLHLRRRLKLSQARLGATLGVGQSAISQYEKGRCSMSPEIAIELVKIARLRGVATSLDEIYAVDADPIEGSTRKASR